MPENVPTPKPIPDIDLATEPVVFKVRRYRPDLPDLKDGVPDANVQFGEISVAALTKHPIFVAAAMTKITRRRLLEWVDTVREIWADHEVVGLHVVFKKSDGDVGTFIALAKVKIAVRCRALTLFETGEYRLDMDASRERALIRLLEVHGIPEWVRPEDRASLGTLGA